MGEAVAQQATDPSPIIIGHEMPEPMVSLHDALAEIAKPTAGRKGAKLAEWLAHQAQYRLKITVVRSGSCAPTPGSRGH